MHAQVCTISEVVRFLKEKKKEHVNTQYFGFISLCSSNSFDFLPYLSCIIKTYKYFGVGMISFIGTSPNTLLDAI